MKPFKMPAPVRMLRLLLQVEPSYVWWTLPQMLLGAVLPLLSVYAPKLILEKLTNGEPYPSIAAYILCFCSVLLLMEALNRFLSGKSGFAADRFSRKLRFKVGKKAMRLALSDIESPAQQDAIRLAGRAEGLTESFTLVQKMGSNLLTILALAAILVRLDLLFLLAVATVLLCKTVFAVWQYRCNQKVRKQSARNDRTGDYLQGLAYWNHGAQKELRVNSLQDWFLQKIKDYRGEMLRIQYRDFRRNALFAIAMAVLTAGEALVVLLLLVEQFTAQMISIADFTMYFSAVTTLTTALSALTTHVEKYREQVLGLEDYQRLTALAGEEPYPEGEIPASEPAKGATVEFQNVSFRYPGTEKYVLEQINLTIHDREKLVIVGLNGSGKTTLIKLLCKFYRPTSGRILFNGVDIWNIPDDLYARKIGAVFQDYQNFAFTLAENIALAEEPNQDQLISLGKDAGLDRFITDSPNGWGTFLSKQFSPDGVELSGGEGQKLAMLRALYKRASLLLLDEPTASLDAKAESELYADFLHISRGTTTVFISHRLAISAIADRIAVFASGRIAEYGNHKELMHLDGLYADMYRKQSASYTA